MLLQQHPSREPSWIIRGEDWYPCLNNKRATVEFSGDEVDGCAVYWITGLKHPLVGVEAAITRQQRRMDIEHAALPPFDERGRQDAHEAGEGDQPRRLLAQQFGERGVIVGSACEAAVAEDLRWDASALCSLEPIGISLVADHQTDPVRGRGALASVDQRLQVAAAARDEYSESQWAVCLVMWRG